MCVCVCKIGQISARTLSFRHQTSRNFFSHSNFPIPYLWTAFCVPLSFVFLRKTIIYNQESGIRNILLSPMASNIKYTMYSIHVTNEQKYQIKCKTVMTWPWARGTPTKTAACSRWHRSHPIRFKIKLSGLLMVN